MFHVYNLYKSRELADISDADCDHAHAADQKMKRMIHIIGAVTVFASAFSIAGAFEPVVIALLWGGALAAVWSHLFTSISREAYQKGSLEWKANTRRFSEKHRKEIDATIAELKTYR